MELPGVLLVLYHKQFVPTELVDEMIKFSKRI